MRHGSSAAEGLPARLRQAIAWVRRTGWPTRVQDMGEAALIIGAREAAAHVVSPDRPAVDRKALLDALCRTFRTRHGPVVARHLCVLFAVGVEPRLRAMERAAGTTSP